MKRLLVLLSLLFSSFTYADTINLHWLNEDGSTYQNSTCVIDSDLILPSTPPTKYGYTFTGWKISTFTPIEYLESTGTQWIDTGYKYTNAINAKMGINRTNTNTADSIFGYRFVNTPTGEGNMRFFFIYEDGRIGLRFGSATETNNNYNPPANNSVIKIGTNQQVNLELRTTERKIYLNGSPVVQAVNEYNTTDFGNIYFFKANATGFYEGDIRGFKGKAYYLQIFDNNTLVRDFIPVLDYNGTPCMFDKITGQFFYNQGSGQFIAGPVLQ